MSEMNNFIELSRLKWLFFLHIISLISMHFVISRRNFVDKTSALNFCCLVELVFHVLSDLFPWTKILSFISMAIKIHYLSSGQNCVCIEQSFSSFYDFSTRMCVDGGCSCKSIGRCWPNTLNFSVISVSYIFTNIDFSTLNIKIRSFKILKFK